MAKRKKKAKAKSRRQCVLVPAGKKIKLVNRKKGGRKKRRKSRRK